MRKLGRGTIRRRCSSEVDNDEKMKIQLIRSRRSSFFIFTRLNSTSRQHSTLSFSFAASKSTTKSRQVMRHIPDIPESFRTNCTKFQLVYLEASTSRFAHY